MKRNLISFLTFLLAAGIAISCSNPTSSAPVNPAAAVTETSYTGTAATTQDEVYNTTIYSAQVLSGVFGSIFSAPASNMRDITGDGYTVTGLTDFEKTYKGTISGTVNKIWNAPSSPATVTIKGNGSFTVDHNFRIWPETTIVDGYSTTTTKAGPGGDTFRNPSDGTLNAVFMANKNASMTASGTITMNAAKVSNTISVSGTPVIVTIEKAEFSITASADATVSNLTMKCIAGTVGLNAAPTSGTFSAGMKWNANLLFVVSSNNAAVKGGKILLSTAVDKSLSNIDITNMYTAINNNPSAVVDTIESFTGDLANQKVTITVWNNANVQVYTGTMTAKELAIKMTPAK